MLTLDDNEKIIYEAHKHWYVFAVRVLVLLIMAVLPPAMYIFIRAIGSLDIPTTVERFLALLYCLWLTILWISVFFSWTVYHLSAWIITEKRVINVDQRSLFFRELSSIDYDKIEEMHATTSGLLPTMLDFGTITIESAADHTDFDLTNVAHPEQVKLLIEQRKRARANTPPQAPAPSPAEHH